MFCSFSLLVQRKRTKRKDTFSKAFLPYQAKPQEAPKFSPRLQKFLTGTSCYAEEK